MDNRDRAVGCATCEHKLDGSRDPRGAVCIDCSDYSRWVGDKVVTVGDLVDHTGLRPHVSRPFLRCMQCGHEGSANKADYFNLLDTREFICLDCNKPLKLVIKEVRYIEITPETWQKGT